MNVSKRIKLHYQYFRHSLRFEFKTSSGNGTLFYAVRRNDLQDMISGSLHEGYPQFKIRCMSSFADFTIPVRVDDGEWHRVSWIIHTRSGNSNALHFVLFIPYSYHINWYFISTCFYDNTIIWFRLSLFNYMEVS
jgi:hypothetical protein